MNGTLEIKEVGGEGIWAEAETKGGDRGAGTEEETVEIRKSKGIEEETVETMIGAEITGTLPKAEEGKVGEAEAEAEAKEETERENYLEERTRAMKAEIITFNHQQ